MLGCCASPLYGFTSSCYVRTYLAAQDVGIVLGAAALKEFTAGRIKMGFLVLAFLLVGVVLASGTRPGRMAVLGIHAEGPVLGTEDMFKTVTAS